MAHLPAASNPRLHGTRSPVADLPPIAGRYSAPSTAEPKQTPSLVWHISDSEPRHTKRSAAGPNTPVRRSPRYLRTPVSDPTATQDMEAPSLLAASHQNHRPQLTLAYRRLYGTAQHKGILAGLAILKLYCECRGTTWTGNPGRDPVVFFQTADMADTSRWQRLPAEFDKNQAKAYSLTQPDHPTNLSSDRSSGLGPVNGRPP
jgi:hypothetical protein